MIPGTSSAPRSTSASHRRHITQRNHRGRVQHRANRDRHAILITLSSGRQQPVDVDLNPLQLDGAIVWSPDSRWLFAATANGSLAAINADTAHVGNVWGHRCRR
jgi:hypothetical protein